MKIWLVFFSVVALATSAEAYAYDNCEDFCESGLLTQTACRAESNCEWDDDDVADDVADVYYCSNDGAAYARYMGGISCPEGAGNVPTCPDGEDCVCTDVDGSCTDGDDDWSYKPRGACWSSVGRNPCDPDSSSASQNSPDSSSASQNSPDSSSASTPPSCVDVCPEEAEYYLGRCGWFSRNNDERWCTSPIHEDEFCCASTSDDCCLIDEGRIAGVAISIIFAIFLCSASCCYFNKSCCFKYRRNENSASVTYVRQPGVQMQQMSYPQDTYPQQR